MIQILKSSLGSAEILQEPESDPEQYRRFFEMVKELEESGELSPTEAHEKFERALAKVTGPNKAPK